MVLIAGNQLRMLRPLTAPWQAGMRPAQCGGSAALQPAGPHRLPPFHAAPL